MPTIVYPQHLPINAASAHHSHREKGRSNADLLNDFRAKKGIGKRYLRVEIY